MKRFWKALLIVGILLLVVFLTVFILAKAKIILLNRWFVDEKRSTIGVDLSAYQADVDMKTLKAQGVAFAYIKATEGSSHQDKRFPGNWKNAAEAGLLSGAYHFFSYSSPAGRFVFLCRLLRMPFLPPVSRRRRIARIHGLSMRRSWRCRISQSGSCPRDRRSFGCQ